MRYPLNRCDYHFLTLQRGANEPKLCRFKAVMGFDVDGTIPQEELQSGLTRALRDFPVLSGYLRYSPIFASPQWQVDEPRPSVGDIYIFEDINDQPDPIAAADAAMERVASGSIDLSRSPIIRLHHIRAGRFDRVLLVWPHPLMDGQGGYEVLRRLAASANDGEGSQSRGAGDGVRMLPRMGIMERLPRAIRGYRDQRAVSRIQTKLPATGSIDAAGCVRIVRRLGQADSFAIVAAAAKRLAPAGPGLYARHLAGCTLRALRRLYDNHGWATPNYAISFPMRPGNASASALPLGNYLVAAALQISHHDVFDRQKLGSEIARQVNAFTTSGADLDQWALLGASSWLRPNQYYAVMKSSVAMTPLISGYSYFQADDPHPIEHFSNRPIVRTLFGGVVTIPPGWNPAFWRHGTHLSMSLAWPVGLYADELANEFADLIESEAIGAA